MCMKRIHLRIKSFFVQSDNDVFGLCFRRKATCPAKNPGLISRTIIFQVYLRIGRTGGAPLNSMKVGMAILCLAFKT